MSESSVARSVSRREEGAVSEAFKKAMKRTRQSGLDHKCKCGACRLCVMAKRYEQGMDIWAGTPLTGLDKKNREEIGRGRGETQPAPLTESELRSIYQGMADAMTEEKERSLCD